MTRPPFRIFQLPLLILVLSVSATLLLGWQFERAARSKDEERFANAVDRLQDTIDGRIATYVAILRAGAGLLDAEPQIDAAGFHQFVDRLRLHERYPGIQGVGFSQRVSAAQVDALVRGRQRAGDAAFHVWPDQPRDEFHVIVQLEPLDRRNRAAIGYDMFTDPARREAMVRARDVGDAAASAPVTLVQEIDAEKQSGFLIYMPVYDGGGIPPTVEERRARLRGFIFAPFRAGDLFAGIVAAEPNPRAGFELRDVAAGGPVLYRSDVVTAPRLRAKRSVDVAGRQWEASFFSLPGLEQTSDTPLLGPIWWSGLALSALLALFVGLESLARYRAAISEQAARDAAGQFEQLANSIPQLAWMAHPDGWIYWYNERWYEYTGATPDDMAGWGWKRVHDPDMLPAVMERWGHSIASGEPFDMEFPLRGADGSFRWFLTRVMPLRDSSGAIVQWFGTNTDVQARRDAERAVREQSTTIERLLASERQARADAERASRMKDEFLATLSHELRTPLNAIQGWAHLLATGAVGPERARSAIETILRNARLQSQLIEELLDMSRITSGRVQLETQDLRLDDLLTQAVAAIRPAAEAKGLTVALDPDGAALVRGDGRRLQQVFGNLLANAVKFTDQGRIDVRLTHVGHHFEVAIRDTGSGIAPEFLPSVFDRFRQADGSVARRHGGLGLGLSIVKTLVELHGGAVAVTSDGPGLGATFTVQLPEAEPRTLQRTSSGTVPATAASPLAADALAGTTVLAIDDDDDSRELLRDILVQYGATVVTAGSAREALNAFRQRPHAFDLIVSDIGMPAMDGYELIRAVRALAPANGGRIAAVALTAYAAAEDRTRALDAGYQAHVAKPVVPHALVAACVSVLRRGGGASAEASEPDTMPAGGATTRRP